MGAELLEDSFPHGTVEGYNQGCRNAHCPAALSCRDVQTRYRGDWSFKRRLDAGVPLEQILTEDAAALTADRETEKRAGRVQQSQRVATPVAPKAEKLARPTKPRATAKARPATAPTSEPRPTTPPKATKLVSKHGTPYGFQRGCRKIDECPNVAAGLKTCTEANREYHRTYAQKRRERAGQGLHGGTITHGTPSGYQLGCHERTTCPGSPDGTTCADASLLAEERRRRKAGVPEKRPVVPSDGVVRHLTRLRAHGLGYTKVAKAIGLSKTQLRSFVYGREDYTPTGFGPRHGLIPKHIDAEKAAKILAFQPWGQA